MNSYDAKRRFRISLYASLASACIILAYAEWPFLRDATYLTAIAIAALFVAYRMEDRWSLSIRAANVVGGLIAIIIGGWFTYQFFKPFGTLLDFLPWPASMLPFLGPLVLVLIPAKLFRPKHEGDYWGLQLIGLMTVALACALVADGITAGLTVVYAVLAIRCLSDFYLARHDSDQALEQTQQDSLVWTRTAVWGLTCGALAVFASIATPRLSDARWEYTGLAGQLQTGISEDRPTIDLNLSGDLRSSGEVAFEVRAENGDRTPRLDVSPAQRWRGATFSYYDRGKWENSGWYQTNEIYMPPPPRGPSNDRDRPSPSDSRVRRSGPARALPNLGPRQSYFVFTAPERPRAIHYLADPVWPPELEPGQRLYGPVETETEYGRFPWRALPIGDVFPPIMSGLPRKNQYRQVWAPWPDNDVSPPVGVDAMYVKHLKSVPNLPNVRDYSIQLFGNLAVSGRLTGAAAKSIGDAGVPAEQHEAVARAVNGYFQTSGVFEYTTNLSRQDAELDPVEDFLLNIRAGHCNRFSSALALVLRYQGIPTRVVLGFAGTESRGDGSYVVRQSTAHSWVEALIQRTGKDVGTSWHWLSLDPTPPTEAAVSGGGGVWRWLEDVQQIFADFFRNFVVDLNADRQDQAAQWLVRWSPIVGTKNGWIATGLAATLILGLFGVKRLVRHRQHKDHAVTNTPYLAFLEIIRKHHRLDVPPTWTAGEIISRLHADRNGDGPELATIAREIARFHGMTKFGDYSAKPDEIDHMYKRVRDAETLLASRA